jgi:integrase
LRKHRRSLLDRQAAGLTEGWIFPSGAGTLRTSSSLRKPLLAALKIAQIDRRQTAHGFRRTLLKVRPTCAGGDARTEAKRPVRRFL